MIALAILLLRNLLAKFTLRREQPAVHNLKTFVVFGFGQRNLPQVIDQASARMSKQFSIAPHALTSAHPHAENLPTYCKLTAIESSRSQAFAQRCAATAINYSRTDEKSPEGTPHRSPPRKWWEAIHAWESKSR
jgi:hypothetical protein